MEMKEWLEKAAQSILDQDEESAREIAKKSLEDDMDPVDQRRFRGRHPENG